MKQSRHYNYFGPYLNHPPRTTVLITTVIVERRLDDKLAQCLCQVIQSSATAVCTPPHRNSDSKMPSYVHITLAPAERALYEAVAL